MTDGVKSALAQPHGVKPKTGRPSPQKPADESSFGQALQAAGPGKPEVGEKAPAVLDARWLRPDMKAEVATDRSTASKPEAGPVRPAAIGLHKLVAAEDEAGDEMEAEIEEAPQNIEDVAEPERATAGIFFSIPLANLPHPAFSARNVARSTDAEMKKTESLPTGAKPIAVPGPVDGEAQTPIRVEPAQPPRAGGLAVAPNAEAMVEPRQPPAARIDAMATKQDAANPREPDAKTAAVRATVLAEQSFPAPAPAPASPTAGPLIPKIAAAAALLTGPANLQPHVPAAPMAVGPAHSLKLQLHPAELGVVTASLRFVGEQLSVELQVENNQAYQRLSDDSETIVKSLRGLGYEIDRVTVMQSPVATPAPTRADADPSLANQAPRGQNSFDQENSNGGGERLGGRNSGERGDGSRQNGQGNAARPEDRAGGGLYI